MRSGLILLAGAAGALAAVVACPPGLRDHVADNAGIPDHVYDEAGRQIDTFVAWARDPAELKSRFEATKSSQETRR